ncbi:MAG TPA: 4-hydroxy-3-methylbut-2-enyl diphosphate reductase [Acidobacteriota bacterium]|nr:4-hydroxy-3-methylbut-2-enyl diphosphate reductase [Acidobacteriota bacterium]
MENTMKKRIVLATPRGFCAGVVRAIDIVNLALEAYGSPIYVLNEIVHNRYVVDELRLKGVKFVKGLEDVPSGSRVIFSAHGISPEIRNIAAKRQLKAIDATCPLVTKVHLEAIRYKKEGYTIILIGHEGHEEVIGTLGEAPENMVLIGSVEEVDRLQPKDPNKLAFLTQTTLSLDDTREIVNRLRERFPQIKGPSVDDICYATQNRQVAIQQVAKNVDLVIVIGSKNSSNSNRLVEVSEKSGTKAYLVDDAEAIQPEWLQNVTSVGITAGASSPELLVAKVMNHLHDFGFTEIQPLVTVEEDVHFALPPELEKAVASRN